MPCRLLLNISNIGPQTHLTGAFEALYIYTGDKTGISTPGKYSNHPCYKPIQNQPNNKQLKSNFMRRLLLLLCLTLAMAVPAMAESAVLISCPFVKSSMETNVDNYTTQWTYTYDNHSYTIDKFSNHNKGWDYIRCGSRSVASTASIATNFEIPEAIDKIEVTIDAVTATNVNSVYLQISDNANFSNPIKIDPDASIAVGPLTYTIQNPAPNKYYKLVFDCKKSSNGIIQVSKVEYFGSKGDAKETNPMTFGKDAVTVFLNSTEYDLPVLADKPDGVEVTFASTDTNVATVDVSTGVVNVLAAGNTTISATATANDTYYGKTVEYTLKVIDASQTESGGYHLLTNLNDLVDGSKGIVVCTTSSVAMGTFNSSNKFDKVSVTIADNIITELNGANVITFGKSTTGGYSLKTDAGYIGGGSNTNFNLDATASQYGNITLNEQTHVATIRVANAASARSIRYNGSSDFRNYSGTGTGDDVQIYIEKGGVAYEAPAAVYATFEGNSSLEGENLYIVAGENVTVTLPVPEGVLAYYYINDDTKMIRYTAPFEVSAGDIVGYYTEQYGLKSEEKMFEVKGIDFSGIAPELKGFNGEHAVMVSFDLTGFDGSVWYKFNDAATAAPALVTPAEEGYTEYAEPFKIAAVGTLTYKAESHGLMSAPVEKSITGEDLTTGVENVVVSDDSEAAYYDLNGRRVTNPAAGIYIRIAGGKATKAIIR